MSSVEDILMVKGPDVVVAGPDNTVEQAAKMMCQANVGSVIVKDDGAIAGIFTERDMLVRVVAKGLDPKTVKLLDVMSSPVKTCTLDDSVESCVESLEQQHIRRLVVVDDGVLIGVIGTSDVMHAQLATNAKHIEELERLLN